MLDPAYRLGGWYDLVIREAGGFVEVGHNAVLRALQNAGAGQGL